MSRYFTSPRCDGPADDEMSNWFPNPLLPSLDVSDHEPVCTGLFDHRGDPIWRGPNPVGFHNPRERA